MKAVERNTIQYLKTQSGEIPFLDWLNGQSEAVQAMIMARLGRVKDGLMGDHHMLEDAEGILELRIHEGQGFRIYFKRDGRTIIVIIIAGTKRTQDRDIKRAVKLWRNRA